MGRTYNNYGYTTAVGKSSHLSSPFSEPLLPLSGFFTYISFNSHKNLEVISIITPFCRWEKTGKKSVSTWEELIYKRRRNQFCTQLEYFPGPKHLTMTLYTLSWGMISIWKYTWKGWAPVSRLLDGLAPKFWQELDPGEKSGADIEKSSLPYTAYKQ